jgi:hypothetical protein
MRVVTPLNVIENPQVADAVQYIVEIIPHGVVFADPTNEVITPRFTDESQFAEDGFTREKWSDWSYPTMTQGKSTPVIATDSTADTKKNGSDMIKRRPNGHGKNVAAYNLSMPSPHVNLREVMRRYQPSGLWTHTGGVGTLKIPTSILKACLSAQQTMVANLYTWIRGGLRFSITEDSLDKTASNHSQWVAYTDRTVRLKEGSSAPIRVSGNRDTAGYQASAYQTRAYIEEAQCLNISVPYVAETPMVQAECVLDEAEENSANHVRPILTQNLHIWLNTKTGAVMHISTMDDFNMYGLRSPPNWILPHAALAKRPLIRH